MIDFKVTRVSEYEAGENATVKEVTFTEHPVPDNAAGRGPLSFSFSVMDADQQAQLRLGAFFTLAPKATAPAPARSEQ